MAINVQTYVWSLDLPPHLKYVAIALADHARPDGSNARPSQTTLAAKTGLTDRSIRRALGELIARGVIEKVSVGHTGKATNYAFVNVPDEANPGHPRPGSRGGTPDTHVRYPGRPRPDTPDTHVLLTVRNLKEPTGSVQQRRAQRDGSGLPEPSALIQGPEREALLERARHALRYGEVESVGEAEVD